MRSTPPRRPRWPASVTRTSYQVGRPWMLEGKMLRGLTGTPMRRIAFANNSLAEAEPEPLTFANLTTKSLTASRGAGAVMPPPSSRKSTSSRRRPGPTRRMRRNADWRRGTSHLSGGPRPSPGRLENRGSRRLASRNHLRLIHRHHLLPRPRQVEQRLLHVPGAGRAALGAQRAVQAHVLVLRHDAQCLQRAGHVQILGEVRRRRDQARAQFFLGPVRHEADAVHRADVHARVALDAQLLAEHGLHVAVEAALRLAPGGG